MLRTFLTLSILSLCSSYAQRVITRDDIKDPDELKAYDLKIQQFYATQTARKPLYLKSAKLATEKLADEILKDNIDYAILNIYPRWKAHLASRVGGQQQLILKAREAVKQMRDSKTEIVDIKVGTPTDIYYVHVRQKKGLAKVVYPFDYNFQKLVIVPLSKHVKFGKTNPETGKPYQAIQNSYQLAVYDEVAQTWSFIDGSGITVNDIRNLFPTIPLTIKEKLPKSGKTLK